jgi:hypothetical protein
MSTYFIADSTNCGKEKRWDFDKQNDFYIALQNGNAFEEVQNWYDTFEQISKSITFAHR